MNPAPFDMLLFADVVPWLQSLWNTLPVWVRPLWIVLLLLVGGLASIWLMVRAMRLFAPKVAAVAGATAKEAMSQPLFYVLMALGVFAILIFPFVPHFTFGEDLKMFKAEGLTLIKLLAVILAVWSASVAIANEIEGRTALTLLSKPIGRRQLMFGKYLGVLIPVAVMFLVLGAWFLVWVSWKVPYDARESSALDPTFEDCRREILLILPGLALSFFEAAVLASIAVAISTRLPMLPNLLISSLVYALGHLLPTLVQVTHGRMEIVGFFGRLLATVLPVLEYFSVETAIAAGRDVPWSYVGWTGLYCVLYSSLALTLGLFLFEDRDLA